MGSTLYTNAGDVVGFGRVDLSSTSNVAIEVLLKLDADACSGGGTAPSPDGSSRSSRTGSRTAEQPSTGPTWSSRSTPAVGTRTRTSSPATRRTCPAGTPSSPRAPAPRPTRRPSGTGSTSSTTSRRCRPPTASRSTSPPHPDLGPRGVPSPRGHGLTSGSWQRPSPTGRTPSCWKRRRLISLHARGVSCWQPDRRMGRLLRRGRRRRDVRVRVCRDELAEPRHADRPAVPGGLRG